MSGEFQITAGQTLINDLFIVHENQTYIYQFDYSVWIEIAVVSISSFNHLVKINLSENYQITNILTHKIN